MSSKKKKPKRKSKKKSTPKKPKAPEPVPTGTGDIRQGTIAKFMRKRTQLVGFETGLNKHTQFAIEFLDNAIDAVESWWWKTSRHPRLDDQLDPKYVEKLFADVDNKNPFFLHILLSIHLQLQMLHATILR